MNQTIVQFGAGNIGRSLVGQLFSLAGWEVVFVDALEPLVAAMNQRGRYDVVVKDTLAPGQPDRIGVTNCRALLASDTEAIAEAIASADLVSTAVGPNVLPKIAPTLAAGLTRRSEPISILFCENLRRAATFMREQLAQHLPEGFDIAARVGLVETSIGKMVPIMPAEVTRTDPLVVWAEAYNQIIADRAAFLDTPPDVPGLVLKDNFAAYVDRKLFIHNLGHAAAAYFGHLAGLERIWQAMDNPAIRRQTRTAMAASAAGLIARYPDEFNQHNQDEHVDDLLSRFANRALNDSVYRVGRDLYRKLAPDDRCIGSLRLVQETGGDAEPILRTIAAALCFRGLDEHGQMFDRDEEFLAQLDQIGPAELLRTVCGLDRPDDQPAIDRIVTEYQSLQKARP
jgi:mannitol-1-phosphate 5-dehydrogenase